MLPLSEIVKYGGKGAILNHIRDNAPEIPIPRYFVKEEGKSLWSVRKELRDLQYPLIVRSSSPYEYADFEGIFESIPDVRNKHLLKRAMRLVKESAKSEKARTYAQQHGFEIGDRINLIIQEQSPSVYSGAMMRHPNDPDLIFMNYFENTDGYRTHKTYLFNTKTQDKEHTHLFPSFRISNRNACFLADQYARIEELTDIAEGHSLYVEFGLEPFFLYQVRPFKKIETADFTIPEADDSMLESDLVFGITPPEGIVYPILRSFSGNRAVNVIGSLRNTIFGSDENETVFEFGELDSELQSHFYELCIPGIGLEGRDRLSKILKEHNQSVDAQLDNHCLMTTNVGRESYDIDLTVPNMKALVTGGIGGFLTHDVMRLVKQADVTIADDFLLHGNFFRQITSGDKVRIISNGKSGIVMRE